jgi:uncharacterized membrane protein
MKTNKNMNPMNIAILFAAIVIGISFAKGNLDLWSFIGAILFGVIVYYVSSYLKKNKK